MTVADIPLAGWIGAPQVSQMIKLVDVPELGYFVTDKPHPVKLVAYPSVKQAQY